MGILDPNYCFFINSSRTGALSFKVCNRVAIIGGDPLCDPSMFDSLLDEFAVEYRKPRHLGVAFLGASKSMAEYAQRRQWTTMNFGTERVLNSLTNDVLLEKCGKRIVVQNKQLLNATKGGITLGLYMPSVQEDLALQDELVSIYDTWRLERNRTIALQAFITVYDPFSLPDLMTYIYTRGPDGLPNGFAALRKINNGYHVDPCIAVPGAPKGISDLLMFACMSFLNRAGVSYLGLGFEPSNELGDIWGMHPMIERIVRSLYRHYFDRLAIGGKKAYHDKFKPDQLQETGLYIVFPSGVPGPREMLAMSHMANISVRKLMFSDASGPGKNGAKRKQQQQQQQQQQEKEKKEQEHEQQQQQDLVNEHEHYEQVS